LSTEVEKNTHKIKHMVFAVISDIHSNLEALNRALEFIKTRDNIDDVVVLGDIVGYGANPNECITICKEVSDTIVLGNHDKAAFNKETRASFNVNAVRSAEWTEENLEDEHIISLKNLPLTINREKYLFYRTYTYSENIFGARTTGREKRKTILVP